MDKQSSKAGGFLIVLGILAGVFIGIRYNAPVPGGMMGLAAGAVAATALWLVDRKKG